MAENQGLMGYGYEEDSVKVSTLKFGLNTNTFMTKFEFNPNGGKDNAAQECIDIVFNINGTDKSYKLFPVAKIFKNGQELTDTSTEEYRTEYNNSMKTFNAVVTHILHCYSEPDVFKPIINAAKSFKEYAQKAASTLPANFKTKELDIFLQWQWQPSSGQSKTYLEIPRKMVYGRFLAPHQEGNWVAVKMNNPADDEGKALKYVSGEGEAQIEHPFTRTGWFMNSNFSHQTKAEGSEADESAAAVMNAPAPTAPAPLPTAATGASW